MHACLALLPPSWRSVTGLLQFAGSVRAGSLPIWGSSGFSVRHHNRRHRWSRSGVWCKSVGCLGWLGLSWEGPQFQGLERGPRTRPKPIIHAIRLAVSLASEGQGPTGALTACIVRPQFHHAVVSTPGWEARSVQACMLARLMQTCTSHQLHTRKITFCMQFCSVAHILVLSGGTLEEFTLPVGLPARGEIASQRRHQHL